MSLPTTILFAAIAGLAIMTFIFALQFKQTYNKLVALMNLTDNSFSQINIQLKRRHDLIPNLVECVKGYMGHEKETLEAVISARNAAAANLKDVNNPKSKSGVASLAQSESMLGGAIGRLNFVMEAYPELKADAAVAQLTEELTSSENRIAFARQAFNDLATDFNIYRQSFPTIFIASAVGFKDDYSMLEFENAEEIKTAPQIQLV